jgi:DNA primase catalytic core
MTDTAALLDVIYSQLDVETALSELEPKKRGKYYQVLCPACQDKSRSGYIYEGGRYIGCNRQNKCGQSITVWDYIANRDSHQTAQETLQALARLAGYELPQTLDSNALEAVKRSQAHASTLEAAQSIFTRRLFSPDGKKELAYLHERGYTDDDIQAMQLGSIPSPSALDDMLKDETVNNVNIVNTKIAELSVIGYGTTHTLSIPYRDYRGRLVGFIARTISDAEPKYKYSKGLPIGAELFNLAANKGVKQLTIVEGTLDALLATARGVQGVVAAGRNQPTAAQLDHAATLGIASITLALDQDEAGQKGTIAALDALIGRPIQTYVLAYPDSIKDADELIRKQGAKALQEQIQTAQSGALYLISCLHGKHSKQEKLTAKEKRQLMDEALALEERISDPIATQEIISTLINQLGLTADMLKPVISDYHERKARAKQKQGYDKLQAKAASLREQGKYDELEQLYAEELPSLRVNNVNTIIEPYTVDRFTADLQHRKDGYETGFTKLDEFIRIPTEAITIIAGRPAHGKTTVMLNLLYNLIEAHPEQQYYFFSYEETRSQLALKLMTIIAGIQLDAYHNTRTIEHYYKTGQLDAPYYRGDKKEAKEHLDSARAYYQQLVSDGRLWIIDEPLLVDDLAGTIEQLAQRQGNIGAVFIDYLQKIKSKYNAPTRQVEIQKVSERLLETAKRASVAIITGAQLNRGAEDKKTAHGLSLDQLRESGDIEQDAHLVLGVFNHARAQIDAKEDASTATPIETELDIKVLKNRSGPSNEKQTLYLHQPTLQLREDKQL